MFNSRVISSVLFGSAVALIPYTAMAGTTQKPKTNANRVLETQFDTILNSKMPMLGDGIQRMLQSNNAYLSNSFQPYAQVKTNNSGLTEGITKDGTRYSVVTSSTGSQSTATFSKNGIEEYTFTIRKPANAYSHRLKLVSSLHNIRNPAYDVSMRVYKKDSFSQLNADTSTKAKHAILEVRFAGRTVREDIWPGKKKFQHIGRLARVMSSLPRLKNNDLNNFFYLLSVNPKNSSLGWNELNYIPGGLQFQKQTAFDFTGGGVHPMLKHWPYWCAVGTIGADVVFTLAGSFGYGVLCGALGEAGE